MHDFELDNEIAGKRGPGRLSSVRNSGECGADYPRAQHTALYVLNDPVLQGETGL